MTFTKDSRMGDILRSKPASDLLDKHFPNITRSVLAIFNRGKTLDEFSRLDPSLPWPEETFNEILNELSYIPSAEVKDIIEPLPIEDLENLSVPIGSAPTKILNQCEKWNVFEIEMQGPREGCNPFTDVRLTAEFSQRDRTCQVLGFYDGNGIYKIRFMPDCEGTWHYKTSSSARSLDKITGEFKCIPPLSGQKGMVRVHNTFHFAYDTGETYLPVGTTCYAWTHQNEELETQTLSTLRNSPFNKLRMCVFPKWYLYNDNEPRYMPFEGSLEEGWDFTKFNPEFFRHLENRIEDLAKLGIEADLILFHPYDRWGFSEMTKSEDDRYLRYVIARLSAYRNVWWSFANEFDLMWAKGIDDWERFAKITQENDPYKHLMSIHNCREIYDHNRSWITHCSLQRTDMYRTAENVTEWRQQWNKPIVIDECAYEGNIDQGWGNITAEEMTRRFWEGALRGGYVGHGETYMHPEEVLWWSKGGELHGGSPTRISFLKKIIEQCPGGILEPIFTTWDVVSAGIPDKFYLLYYGFNQPIFREFRMSAGVEYKVDVIDTWNMTVTELPGTYEGTFRVELPSRQYMAVRMTAVK